VSRPATCLNLCECRLARHPNQRHDRLRIGKKGWVLQCDAATFDRSEPDSFPPPSTSTHRPASAGACISPKSLQKFESPLRAGFRSACATAGNREPIDRMPGVASADDSAATANKKGRPASRRPDSWARSTYAALGTLPGPSASLITSAMSGRLQRQADPKARAFHDLGEFAQDLRIVRVRS